MHFIGTLDEIEPGLDLKDLITSPTESYVRRIIKQDEQK